MAENNTLFYCHKSFSRITHKIDSFQIFHPDFRSRPEKTEVDIDMISTDFDKTRTICNNLTKNRHRNLFGSVRVLAKIMLGVKYSPVAGKSLKGLINR